jgi:glycosyltransferase involved in cell wall biosynthesis
MDWCTSIKCPIGDNDLKIQLLTSPEAISFSEVARVMKTSFDNYNYDVHIGNISDFYIPNVMYSPLSWATWDILIMICTLLDNVSERFKIFGSRTYTKKAWYYAVIEGQPILKDCWKPIINNKIITPSEFCKKHIEKAGVKVKRVIPHGIIHREFEETPPESFEIREEYKGHHILLFIANACIRKATPQLIDALSLLKEKRQDWICLMHVDERIRTLGCLGECDHTPIDKLIHQHKLEHFITFTKTQLGYDFGKLGRKQISALYHACDLHLMPSYSEGFGIPLIEVGASHKTSVYTDTEPMNEIEHETCGYPLPSNNIKYTNDYPYVKFERHLWNSQELADIIDYALSNPKEREEKEERNYQNSLRYDYKTIYRQFLELQ